MVQIANVGAGLDVRPSCCIAHLCWHYRAHHQTVGQFGQLALLHGKREERALGFVVQLTRHSEGVDLVQNWFQRQSGALKPTNSERVLPMTKQVKSLDKMRDIANSLIKRAAVPEGRGACIIVFNDGVTPNFCHNGMTDAECKQLAVKLGGDPRPVTVGSVCAN